MKKISFNTALAVIIFPLVLTGCKPNVPERITSQCRAEATRVGFGRCTVERGRENSFGVWVVQMDCTRGVAACTVNSGGPWVSEWTGMSEIGYRQ